MGRTRSRQSGCGSGRTGGTELTLAAATAAVVGELAEAGKLGPGKILVVGVSTSEVAGVRIGTGGALEVAEQLLQGVRQVADKWGFIPYTNAVSI